MRRKKMIFTISMYVPANDTTLVGTIESRMNTALHAVCDSLKGDHEDNELCYALSKYQHTDEGIER